MILEQTLFENAWRVEEGLYRILLPLPWNVPFVNAYLVESRGEYMLVDCGLNWNPSLRALGRGLKAIGVPARGLTYLLLTHRHSDHSGGVGPVHDRWGGRVLTHPAEAAKPPRTPEAVHAWVDLLGLPLHLRPRIVQHALRPVETAPPPIEPLDLSEPLVLGDLQFEVISAPGHSAAQAMLYEPARGWLLAADQVLPAPAPNVWHQPGDPRDPFSDYLESLERTGGLEARLVLPGHGAPARGGFPAASAAMKQFHLQFAETLQQMLRDEALTPWELTRRLAPPDDDDEEVLWATSAVFGALRYLQERGLAEPQPDGRWGHA